MIARIPPSQILLASAFAIANELKQLPREELVALARKAKGSLKDTSESATAVIRRLRDEWETDVADEVVGEVYK
jgi:uncharacterized protein with von Willebrand factor type A (vWA) domain